jgi:hypothetical protein
MAGLSYEAQKKMLSIIRSKSCKRCGGDLSIECDIYGVYIECIQCGATFHKNEYIPANIGAPEEPDNKKKAETVADYMNGEIPPRPKVVRER